MGARPCSLTKFTMSSNPAITRSSFAVRAPAAFVSCADAEFGEQFIVAEIVHWRSSAFCPREEAATPSAIRFSHASCERIEGRRPRSLLNFSARIAKSSRLFDRHADLACAAMIVVDLLADSFRSSPWRESRRPSSNGLMPSIKSMSSSRTSITYFRTPSMKAVLPGFSPSSSPSPGDWRAPCCVMFSAATAC